MNYKKRFSVLAATRSFCHLYLLEVVHIKCNAIQRGQPYANAYKDALKRGVLIRSGFY